MCCCYLWPYLLVYSNVAALLSTFINVRVTKVCLCDTHVCCVTAASDSVSFCLRQAIVNQEFSPSLNLNQPNCLPLTTVSVYTGCPNVIFTFSHKVCIVSPEQGFPVFGESWSGANKLSLHCIQAVKNMFLFSCVLWGFLVMPVRYHDRGMSTNDIIEFIVPCLKLNGPLKSSIKKDSVSVLKMSYASYITGGCPTYVSV